MNPADALAEVGVTRGRMRFVAASTVSPLRKYLTAMGIPGAYVASMSRAEWMECFNDISDAAIQRHAAIAKNKGDNGDYDVIEAEIIEDVPANVPPVIQVNPPAPARVGSLDAAIEAIVEHVLSRRAPAIDVSAVTEIVRRELNNQEPRVVVFRERDKEDIRLDVRTPLWFERVVKLLKYGESDRINVCLVGPTGCGKTHIIPLIAAALGCKRHTIISGSTGVTEAAITGRLLPTGDNGRFEYSASEFVQCYEGGSALICFDEIDAFDDNMLMCANVPLANGHMYVHHRISAPCVKRGDNVYFIATANTFGTSANPIYSSRNKLDGATLNRFVMIPVDYDTRFEEEGGLARGLTAAEIGRLWDFRAKVREKELRRSVSTRDFFKAAVMKQCGDDWSTVMDTLTAGWSADEKQKVGLAA